MAETDRQYSRGLRQFSAGGVGLYERTHALHYFHNSIFEAEPGTMALRRVVAGLFHALRGPPCHCIPGLTG